MTTAAAWQGLPGPLSGRGGLGGSTTGPRLVVIEGGRSARVRGAVVHGSLVLRVPRWVRLALTMSVVVLAAALLLGTGGASAAPGSGGSVEVRPGQTLSEIAQTQMPGLETAEAVARIQLANNLPSSHVTAGQVIVIPGH